MVKVFTAILAGLIAAVLQSCTAPTQAAQTALDHPLSETYRLQLEQELSVIPTSSLKERLCRPEGLYVKKAVLGVLASRGDDPETLPALHEVLNRSRGDVFPESTFRGDVRVAIAQVESRGVRERLVAGMSALLHPANEKGTIDSAALALQRLGGADAAAALRANETDDPTLVRLARYHVELDGQSDEQAARVVFADAIAFVTRNRGTRFPVGESSYLCSRGKTMLPILRQELVDARVRQPHRWEAYERFLTSTISTIEKQQALPSTRPRE